MSEVSGKITKITQQAIKIDGIAYPWKTALYKNVQSHLNVGDEVTISIKERIEVKAIVMKRVHYEQETS